jgi:hypothetical protein
MSNIAVHFVLGTIITSVVSFWPYITIGISAVFVLLLYFLIRSRKKGTKQPKSKEQSILKNADHQDVLKALNNSSNPVLLAACRLSDLPVTIPVNLAVSLAGTGKCLLIDLDSKRDALAKVFEIDSSKIDRDLKIAPVQTEFENLSIWPARYFNLLKQMNLRSLLDTANKKYNHILLYAPYLTVLADRKQIASCSKHAVIFCKDSKKKTQLQDLLKVCNCKILIER